MTDLAPIIPIMPPALGAQTAQLTAAIANVMKDIDIVAKRGVNEFHCYRYATMGDILKEITPLLGRHGLAIFQSETGRTMFDNDNVIAIEYAFIVAHESGETWPHALRQSGVSTCRNSKGGWDDKSLNKCHTAARKYFLLSLFQIPTGEEDDADKGENDAHIIRKTLPARIQRNLDRIAPKPGGIAEKHPDSFPPGAAELFGTRPARTVVPAKPGGVADRAMVARAHQSWARPAGPSKAFFAADAGRRDSGGFNERNPPPHDDVPDHAAGKALNQQLHPMNDELPDHSAKPAEPPPTVPHRTMMKASMEPLDHTDRGGIPEFCRRKPQEEPSYLDLYAAE